MADESPRKIQSLETAHRITEALQELDGAGASAIADRLDIGRSTAYQYLMTLREEGYVTKREQTYHIGLKYLDHGMYARDNHPMIEISRPSLRDLVDETGEIGWCTSEDNGKLVTLDIIEGDRNLNTKFSGRIGNREYMNAHAGGKAILSGYSDSRIMEIIDAHGMPSYTEQTITDEEALLAEIERVREKGVAFNDEEAIEGYRAVGAPVTLDGETIGSITIGGPKNRMPDEYFEETLPDLIRGVINEIELRGSVSSPWE
ncbi:IclR family transcriptional regulator [Halobellus clavatus]|uniref:Transcriptional regulator, IclR family n=1 Tax=Halobellus clavatus TaxID=660517 RepID=A0A1H3IDP8_9EURY|nr:IclR family transcriptional regulator [Halobellus clavatus]SDY25389.1 transcriptional regulator, IclR family [Halobellus clavatus]